MSPPAPLSDRIVAGHIGLRTGIDAVTKEKLRGIVSRVYRQGPILITALMLVASAAYSPWQRRESWDYWAVGLRLFSWLAIIWHIMLIATERPRDEKVIYALIHLPSMFIVGL
jgi:hypothetical protein